MPNSQQVKRLTSNVELWNKWRDRNPSKAVNLNNADLAKTNLNDADLSSADIKNANLKDASLCKADLCGVDLTETDLSFASLVDADLDGAILSKSILIEADLENTSFLLADLSGANLSKSTLTNSDLSNARLSEADLSHANLRNAVLASANLSKSNLTGADLTGADLSDANLQEAKLMGAILDATNLNRADLTGAFLSVAELSGVSLNKSIFKSTYLGFTTISRTELSNAIGLNKVIHLAPSQLSTDSIRLSRGKIPEAFLRGCGLSDWEIESSKLHKPGLSNKKIGEIINKIHDLRIQKAVQTSPVFISYSHADAKFVEKLETHLTKLGIRFWRDVHNATVGRLETQIENAIKEYQTVLLILSKNSMNSDWVEHEARMARNLEKELGQNVLCPIALDDSWKSGKWPKRLLEQIMEYNILDFSNWEDPYVFEGKFSKLLRGLNLFYKKTKK